MTGRFFLRQYLQCLDAGKSARNLDTVYSDVLRCRNDLSVVKGENGKGFEIFQGRKWEIGVNKDTLLDFVVLVVCA